MAIVCKGPAEVDIMQRNSQILVTAVDAVESLFSPGVSTLKIDEEISQSILRAGGRPAMKGYYDYPSSICTSINEQVVNTPPSRRVLQKGDLLKLEVGMVKDGYYTKIEHAYGIGPISETRSRLCCVTKSALWAGIEQARIGNFIGDIGNAIQEVVESAGCSVVRGWVGHGIGTRMHEEPQVPNFGTRGHGARLREGMVLQILPLVNEGTPETRVLGDKWTGVTVDGRDSCLMGHVVAIERDGPRVLTFSPRDYHLDETQGQAIALLHVGSAIRVFPLDDLGIHTVCDPETRSTIICGSVKLIQKRLGGFLRSQIDEFEVLINKPGVLETELQRFFELNPNFLLGEDYQSVRCQVILQQEFGGKLIPDFFLEPIVGKFWDIAELKLPNELLTVGKLNGPMYAYPVRKAIEQVRTYANYFDDFRNRDHIFRRYGIMAYRPRLCVVIGRRFEVSDIARRHLECGVPDVRVVTYEELLEKARRRIIG